MVSTLFLVPTQTELDCLSNDFRKDVDKLGNRIELCGFGVVVSAIRATRLIAEMKPKRVLLLGVAGALDSRLQVSEAIEFDEAVCFGIGTGSGDRFVSANEMGWKQWPGPEEISDTIKLGDDNLAADKPGEGHCLLTCCSASANQLDVQWRLKKHPTAGAEDMEGFSVAVACRFAGVPLRIVRGISNLAGDRNKSHWRLREAMVAVEKKILNEAQV